MPKDESWLLKEKYHGELSEAFFADCKRLALGEPLGYLIGFVPFLHCRISLDSKPLIPRPETEYWVEKAIGSINSMGSQSVNSVRVLDLCAGSGCVGVAVAKHVPQAHVDFSEIDNAHLPTIQKNLSDNNITENRYCITHANLFEGLLGGYDFILSNPPYIDISRNRTDENVLAYEPYIALSGGLQGMEIIEDIITRAPLYLRLRGQLWIEHEPEQSEIIKELGEHSNFQTTTHKDQYGVERFSVLVLQ